LVSALAIGALTGVRRDAQVIEAIAPCNNDRFRMTSTRGVVEGIQVFPAATADTTSLPIRSLSGPHTALCTPRDLAVDSKGQLHVMNSNAIAVYAAGAAGDVAPLSELSMAAYGIGLDGNDNTYVVTWEASPPSDSGSILVFERGAAGERPPSRTLAGPHTGLRRPQGVAVDADGRLYATNGGQDTVRIFERGARGDVAPVAFLAGPHTRLNSPTGLAFDRRGSLYVANTGGNTVTVYPPRSAGDVAPVRTIEAPRTPYGRGLVWPRSVAVDSHDTLYVTVKQGVVVFSPDASGQVPPVRTLLLKEAYGLGLGRNATLYVTTQSGRVSVFAPGASDSAAPLRLIEDLPDQRGAQGVALGAADTLYVADAHNRSVRVYRPGAHGAAAPVRTLSGPPARLSDPRGITVDRHGTLYLANGPQPATRGAIRVYAPTATDTGTPVRVIRGRQTRLARPGDVAVDSRGYIYAVNRGETYEDDPDGAITIYAPHAQGDVAPVRRITGPTTLLREPFDLAIGPGDTLYVLNGFGGTGLGPTWKYGVGNVTVTVYPPRAQGDVEPIRIINVTGGETMRGGRFPSGIAVDRRGAVFLTDYASPFVSVYNPGAEGQAHANRRIRIPPAEDGNGRPWPYMTGMGVAIGPRDELFVAAFPRQMVFTRRDSRPSWTPSVMAPVRTYAAR
jgi:sugar lactone lactonase YvrE